MFLTVKLCNLESGTVKALDDLLATYGARKECVNDTPVEELRKIFSMGGEDVRRADDIKSQFNVFSDDARNAEALMESLQSEEMRQVVASGSVKLYPQVSGKPVSHIIQPPFPKV